MHTRLTEKEFEDMLAEYLSASAMYDDACTIDDDCTLSRQLKAMQLSSLWSRVIWHSISQHGTDMFFNMLEEDVSLYGLFDWSATEEGWGFWDAVSRLVS